MKLLILLTLFLVPLLGFAQDDYLQISEKSFAVITPSSNALSLDDVQKRVVNDQLDLKISYENLLQAQKKIGQARAQYFPYGIGTIGAMYLLNVWNPLILVELLTSLPSKIFNVQSEKNLRWAQYYSNKALAENIKNQVAGIYYSILKEEAALKLTKIQLSLLEKLLTVIDTRIEAGLSTLDDKKNIEMRVLSLRDDYLQFSAYLAVEKSAFNQMIASSPEDAEKIQLKAIPNFLSHDDVRWDTNEMVLQAINRSPELVAAKYMVTAARKARKSTKWSILSFSGIGFGYWSRVQIAGSKIRDAVLNKEIVQDNLVNQVYTAQTSFSRTLDSFQAQRDLFSETDLFTKTEIAKFKSGETGLDRLIETEIIYLREFGKMIVGHYDSLIKLSNVERAVLGNLTPANLQ